MYNAGSLQTGVATEDGSFDMTPLKADSEERGFSYKAFRGRELRNGALCIANTADNTGIIARFDPDNVQACMIYISEEYNAVSLSIRGNQVTYSPGDEVTVNYKYTILNDLSGIVR